MMSKSEIDPKAKNIPTYVKGMCLPAVVKHPFGMEDMCHSFA